MLYVMGRRGLGGGGGGGWVRWGVAAVEEDEEIVGSRRGWVEVVVPQP